MIEHPKITLPPIGTAPRLTWDEAGCPRAPDFDDGYFGNADALHEIAHVFLNGTELWQRFASWPCDQLFHIGETGFGTGLNFCAAVALWQACRAHGVGPARLHFTSVEAWPLAQADLARALSVFPQLGFIAEQLVEQWPETFEPGSVFNASLMNGELRLSIAIDTARVGLARLTVPGGVNAWFLDGFAPAQNPEMWSQEVMRELNRMSAPGAMLASFTAAGFVRRNLAEAGFNVSRVKGFGRKRHMTKAVFHKRKKRPEGPKWPAAGPQGGLGAGVRQRTAIVGGGIAGALAAFALHNHAPDMEITVFDDPAHAANHPAYASVVPRLDVGGGAHEWIMPRLFEHAVRFWSELGEGVFRQTGAVQTARFGHEQARLQAAAAQLGGAVLADGRVLWPTAGFVDSQKAIAVLLQRAGAAVQHRRVLPEDMPEDILGRFDQVVVCAGNGVGQFLPAVALPAQGRGGQAFILAGAALGPHGLFGKGHILPLADGTAWAGSSFYHTALMAGQADAVTRAAGRAECLEKARHLLQLDGKVAPDLTVLDEWNGIRVVLPDQLPAFGPVPCWADFAASIAGLRHGQWLPESKMAESFKTNPGYHILAGLGARGFMWGPMLADLLAKSMLGLTLPIPEHVAQLFAPWRFLLREERYSRLSPETLLPKGPVLVDGI